MSGNHKRKVLLAAVLGIMALCVAVSAQATVYGWKGVGGVLHLSNDSEAVPEAQRDSAQKFTSKFAGAATSLPIATPSSLDPESQPTNLQMNAYERGLEQGLQTAERQVELAGELARTVLAAAPRTPPPRIIIQQPGPIIIRQVAPDYYPSFFSYGLIGPYASPYWDPYVASYCGVSPRFSFNYSFRCSRFVQHSHFFPGTRGQRGGLFFPRGHHSHHGFLFGSGFVVR